MNTTDPYAPGRVVWYRGSPFRIAKIEDGIIYLDEGGTTSAAPGQDSQGVFAVENYGIFGAVAADDLTRSAPPGPWRYRMSPHHVEAVVDCPEGEITQLSCAWTTDGLDSEEGRRAMAERYSFEGAVHLMANAPSYRQALTAARDALAAGGPDAREQALGILNRALDA